MLTNKTYVIRWLKSYSFLHPCPYSRMPTPLWIKATLAPAASVWKMNHLDQTGLVGTRPGGSRPDQSGGDPPGPDCEPGGSRPDQSGRDQTGWAPTRPVWRGPTWSRKSTEWVPSLIPANSLDQVGPCQTGLAQMIHLPG